MRLSVCLIVKDEEAVIGRCLECASKFADEIIVVDTGSRDKTKEIACKYTNLIYDFKWVDDFSLARNFSFLKATCDYIMWLDADDVIENEDIEEILELKKHLCKDTYMLKYDVAFDEFGHTTFSYYRERIFKKCNLAFWVGFVHEAIAPFGEIEYLDIKIKHKKEKKTKPKRNLRLYQKHIAKKEQLSARQQYYYSKELYFSGYYKKCEKELKKYLKMENKFEPNEIDALLTLSKCYLKNNNKSKALGLLLKNLQNITPNSEYLCEIGDLYIHNNKLHQALIFYEGATNIIPDYKSGQFVNKTYYYLYPYLQLTMIYYRLNDYEKSKKYHILSKACDPTCASVIYNEQFFKS